MYTISRLDMNSRIPGIDNTTRNKLIAFVIAGSGFDNMAPVIDTLTDSEITIMNSLFHRWRGVRSYSTFFRQIFEDFGYSCREVRFCLLG